MIVVTAVQPGELAITVDCGHTVRTWIEYADGRRCCVPCYVRACHKEPKG